MKPEPTGPLGIAELAERAGVTPRTVRYYVAEGLLPPPGGAGQQRAYTYEHLLRLQAIGRLKAAYLPLGEIRRRLAGLSLAELERLVEAPSPPPPNSALEYIASITPAPRPRQPGESSPRAAGPAGAEPRMLLARDYQASGAGRQFAASPEPVEAAGEPPADTVWHRVVLAPGVELSYQLTGDRLRDATIARLIRAATSILGNLPPSSESRS